MRAHTRYTSSGGGQTCCQCCAHMNDSRLTSCRRVTQHNTTTATAAAAVLAFDTPPCTLLPVPHSSSNFHTTHHTTHHPTQHLQVPQQQHMRQGTLPPGSSNCSCSCACLLKGVHSVHARCCVRCTGSRGPWCCWAAGGCWPQAAAYAATVVMDLVSSSATFSIWPLWIAGNNRQMQEAGEGA
jgi:hypothetical protein